MLTLYHSGPTRSRRALWTLEELGLAYRGVAVQYPPRLAEPAYLEVNPVGVLPTLLDGTTRITESTAICQYLATRDGPTGLAVAPGEAGYADYLQFISYGEAMLTQPLGLMVRYGLMADETRKLPVLVEDAEAIFALRLGALDEALADRAFLAADRLTIADISVMYALKLGELLQVSGLYSERVAGYAERLAARPAFQRAYAVA